MKLEVWDEAKLKLQFSGRVLVNTEDEHYKFWSAQIEDNSHYRVYWGRIGKTIQTSLISGGTLSIETKIKEKLRKGYREI
jgi:predicted DNA-binding WGR domain protein